MNTITAQKMNISTAKTPSFKGKWDSTKDGNKYFKTNAGTVMGVLGALGSLTDVAGEKGNKSALLLSVLFGAGLNLATGIYVDKRRNQKVAEAEDYINRAGVEKALQDIEKLDVTDEGKVYYKSTEGVRFYTQVGAWLGLSTVMPFLLSSKVGMKQKVLFAITGLGVGTLAYWLDGKIVDYFSNRTAKKYSKHHINFEM